MVGVVAVVDVGDLQVRLEDGGFDGHGLTINLIAASAYQESAGFGPPVFATGGAWSVQPWKAPGGFASFYRASFAASSAALPT